MDKSEKYDIKEASNPSLKPSARRNYADNAESNAKGVKQTAKQRAKLPAKVVAAIAAKKGAPKQIKPKRSKVPSNKGKTGDDSKVGNKRPKARVKQIKTERAPRKKEKVKTTYDKKGRLIDARTGEFLGGRRKETKPKLTPRSKDSNPPKMKGPYMESNAQEKKNLLTVESWMSKFSQSRM